MNDMWDTTIPVFDYPEVYKKIYDNIYNGQRKSFSNWIGEISQPFKKDLDWWVSSAPSRNSNISNLFNYICILESLKILDKKINFLKPSLFENTTARNLNIFT